ncbi:hypothetical protein GPECTOR_1g241 [Gonium pectorale]|uniref:Uncharacterized protein n=1 Tax=Gonium pectorale TaxID=33097 RepID=A0A150H297_GONPE|nr:hypothetical protein GPECTOR_1g241 [Gonium pectorale]|eukprot:KXZ56276.1 hypothetical protein GPECTOR_1g241 [Gonium pectorale]
MPTKQGLPKFDPLLGKLVSDSIRVAFPLAPGASGTPGVVPQLLPLLGEVLPEGGPGGEPQR